MFRGPMLGGRYYLGPVVGSGSSATVFSGWDARQHKKVAIKRVEGRAVWERRRESAMALALENADFRSHPLLVCPNAVVWPPLENERDKEHSDIFLIVSAPYPEVNDSA